MNGLRDTRALAAGVWVAVALAGCGGSSGGAAGGQGGSALAVEVSYVTGATPRAEGIARSVADAEPSAAAPSVVSRPADTWLRVVVSGPGFAPIVCEFPRRTGGRCDGVPAGSGRTVTVEEWDAAFETLYFRGQKVGVVVEAGRNTRVQVTMRPAVVIRYPVADGGVNRRTFEAQVQTEPGAAVQLFIGTYLAGTVSADASGLARIPVSHAGDGAAGGLADGEYLLTAIALPVAAPGTPLVRHVGAPHSFVVDLVAPALQLSAPSVTSARAVDVAGVTEPGATVRCGEDDPSDDLTPAVGPDGRFVVRDFAIGLADTTIACEAADKAGNATLKWVTVAHRPEGFAVNATMPDVTNQPAAPLTVRTSWTVDTLEITVTGEESGAQAVTRLARESTDGTFAASVTLHRNEWNRVRVAALVGGQELGAAELAVEHDDIRPPLPKKLWAEAEFLPSNEVPAGQFWLAKERIGFAPIDPGTRIDVYDWENVRYGDGLAADGGFRITEGTETLIGSADPSTGIFEFPHGSCYHAVLGRAVDRAGNPGEGWMPVAYPPLGASAVCIR